MRLINPIYKCAYALLLTCCILLQASTPLHAQKIYKDPARDVVLMLRTSFKSIKIVNMNGEEMNISASREDGPYRKFVIPYTAPWEMQFVMAAP